MAKARRPRQQFGGNPRRRTARKPPPTPTEIITRELTRAFVKRKPVRTAARNQRRLAWKFRYQLAPLVVLLLLYVAGWRIHRAHTEHAVRSVFLIGTIGTGLWWLFTRRWLDRKVERVYAVACCAAAAGWLTVAASHGVGRPMPAVLAGGGSLLALPWWHRFRVRPHVGPTGIVAEWETHVSCDGGPLPGSHLVNVQADRKLETADVRLEPRNKQKASAVIGMTEVIAAHLDVGLEDLAIERHPRGPAWARLTVLTGGNPLWQVQRWDGHGIRDDGTAVVGIYADGSPLILRWWEDESVVHGLFTGSTGSGKSRLLDLVLAVERRSDGRVVSWVGDAQSGQSVPAWARAVDRYATGPHEVLDMLRDAKQVMLARSAVLARMTWIDNQGISRVGMQGITPSVKFPMLSVRVDEAQEILSSKNPRSKEAVALVESIALMGRKTAVGLTLNVNHPGLDQIGNSEALRSNLRAGNIVCLRSTSSVPAVVTGGLLPPPNQLPASWANGESARGSCYAQAGGTVADPRTLMARIAHVDKHLAARVASEGRTWHLPDLPDVPVVEDQVVEEKLPAVQPALRLVVSEPDESGSAAEKILAMLADGGAHARGALFADAGCPFDTAKSALDRLCQQGRVRRVDRGLYALAAVDRPGAG